MAAEPEFDIAKIVLGGEAYRQELIAAHGERWLDDEYVKVGGLYT